jgi:hypothetical protein
VKNCIEPISGHASVTSGGAFLGSDGLRNAYRKAVARIAMDRNVTLKRVLLEPTSASNAMAVWETAQTTSVREQRNVGCEDASVYIGDASCLAKSPRQIRKNPCKLQVSPVIKALAVH